MNVKKLLDTVQDCLDRVGATGWESMARDVLEQVLVELDQDRIVNDPVPPIPILPKQDWEGKQPHAWEPDDTQGTSMTCTKCHLHINNDDAADWDEKVKGLCPGKPVVPSRPWPGCCGMCVHPDECAAKEKEHMWKQAMLVGRYVSVYKPIAGWKALHFWYNTEDPKMPFWEPWSTSDFAFNTKAEAERYAKGWASDESLPYIPNDSEKE